MQQYLVRQHGDEFGISGAVAEKRVVVAENAAYARLVCTLPRVLDSCAYRTLYAGGSCCESLSDSRVQTLGYAVEQSPVSETFKNSAPDVSVTLEIAQGMKIKVDKRYVNPVPTAQPVKPEKPSRRKKQDPSKDEKAKA